MIPSTEKQTKRRRSRFSFRLRTLLILMLLMGCCFGLAARQQNKARQQHAAVERIKSLGGEVCYDFQYNDQWKPQPGFYYGSSRVDPNSCWVGTPTELELRGPEWKALFLTQPKKPGRLRTWFGDDMFNNLTAITLSECELALKNVDNLTWLAEFKDLRWLDLSESVDPIHDLTPLIELRNLRYLNISGAEIKDLSPLKNNEHLEKLNLSDTLVEDLTPLAKLSILSKLNLEATKIKDLSSLAEFENLKELNLRDNDIHDLSPLAGLINLEILDLEKLHAEDLSPLGKMKKLISLYLDGTPVHDLSPLAGLVNLRRLSLGNTKLSQEKVDELQRALPKCRIFYSAKKETRNNPP